MKLGVAHSFQVVDELPAEPHDIKLTAVVDDSLADNALDFRRTEDGIPGSGHRPVSENLIRLPA